MEWSGSSINIPGTGATIDQIPAFLELSLVATSFTIMMVPYVFLSTQVYQGLIDVIAGELSVENLLYGDVLVASKMPIWLFIKYSRFTPIIGRENIYDNSCPGRAFGIILISAITLMLMLVILSVQAATLYIAHFGMPNTVVGWTVYVFCVACTFISVLAILANMLQFTHSINFDQVLSEPVAAPENDQPEEIEDKLIESEDGK